MPSNGSTAYDATMRRYEKQYDELTTELQTLGFIGQGSVSTRRITCGRPACRCHIDPVARHGPYHYWTRKARGKTVGLNSPKTNSVSTGSGSRTTGNWNGS